MLTEEQIAQNYEKLRNLINENFPTRKDQLNQLYDEMENKVLVAPASGYEFFHNAFQGGYVDHVLRVYDFALLQMRMWKHCGMRIDFSEEAVAKAKALNDKLGLDAEFICCDVYDTLQHITEKFDVVYTSVLNRAVTSAELIKE